MPIEPIRRISAAAAEIRQRWTQEERLRRAELANAMQTTLLKLAGPKLVPAYVEYLSKPQVK